MEIKITLSFLRIPQWVTLGKKLLSFLTRVSVLCFKNIGLAWNQCDCCLRNTSYFFLTRILSALSIPEWHADGLNRVALFVPSGSGSEVRKKSVPFQETGWCVWKILVIAPSSVQGGPIYATGSGAELLRFIWGMAYRGYLMWKTW